MPPEFRQIRPGEEPAPAVLSRAWRQAPVGLAVLQDGALDAWNEAARRLLEDAVGGSPAAWSLWLEAACARLLVEGAATCVLAARREGGPAVELALAGDGRAGDPAIVALRAAAPATGRGAPGGLAETVSTLSHELRTPLASMKSSLSLVMSGDAGPLTGDQQRFLGVAARNVARLDRLVGDLLDLSRDEAGRLHIDCRATDLGPVLREAVALGEAADGRGGPRVDASGIPEHFRACVDADKVTQMVANLVGNARKYVPADGRVRVWLDAHPTPPEPLAAALALACGLDVRTFTIVVEDNGPGIDPQVVDRVFEPFERGRAEVIGRIGGAGLGLHIVRRLAEAHGGKVSLASAPGAGTTVWVRLPVDATGAQLLRAASQVKERLRAAPAGSGGCVAIHDGRGAGEAGSAAAAQALAQLPPGVAGPACEVAPGLLVAAVPDPGAWAACRSGDDAGWRLLEVGEPAAAGGDPAANPGKPGPAAADSHA